jgi:hypothetical protein
MVRQQIAIGVEYDGVTVGTYVADFLVENAVFRRRTYAATRAASISAPGA